MHSLFTQRQREKEVQVTLKLPPETRWGYSMQSLESLIVNKGVLRLMAADPDISTDFDNANVQIEEEDDQDQDLPGEVKKFILDDQFWSKVEGLHELLQPIVACLTQVETDDVIMDKSHKLLSTMFSTLESLVKSSVALDSRDKKMQKNAFKIEKKQ